MADISHKDLLESLGNTAAGFTKNLANQAASFACGLYKQYPWALTFGDTGNYSKGVWDELCGARPEGLPPVPTAPFKGGQCNVVPYWIYTKQRDQGGPLVEYSPGKCYGPIGGARFVPSSPPRFSQGFPLQDLEVLCRGFVNGAVPPTAYSWQVVSRQYAFTNALEGFRVERADGGVDNCGDLPSEYPQTPIPPSSRTTVVNVDVHGTTYNIPITLMPTSNIYNVDVQAGDIAFSFDLLGVNVNSNNTTIKNIDNSLTQVNENVTNLTQIVVPFINNSVNFNSSFNFGNFQTEEDSGSSSPADEEQSDNIAYVTLDITRKPVNAKTQEGELAQDLLYAGWFQFAAKGYYFPREPIHFSKAIFKAPYGATDYAYTLYEGFEAKVVIHRV